MKSGKTKALFTWQTEKTTCWNDYKSASALNPQHGRGDNDTAFEKIGNETNKSINRK